MSNALNSLLAVTLPNSGHGIPQLELLLTILLAFIKMIVLCIGLFFCWLAIIVILIAAFAGIARVLRETPTVI